VNKLTTTEFVARVCECPDMWVYQARYYSVAALFDGYDECCGHLDLYPGFHDWLTAKLGRESCPMSWPWMVLAIFLGHGPKGGEELPQELEGDAIKKLGELLLEYLSEKNGSNA